MVTVEENLMLYFYIACGITAGALVILFTLVIVLFVKVNRLAEYGMLNRSSTGVVETANLSRSNQLNNQTQMMSEFCYTNPTIVPGELLSRRGFSMYSGADTVDDDYGKNKNIHYGTYHEARSKF
ncbi:uncharacterized protein LOC109854755 [Pseudomyrmex gracilis]|uniref:uncharacterized protein LOC109854755 n=1 Tax=Pseudomyrmex gracilis TaxID=219809 RepID=UPI000994F0FA|nr:uncharacterized protein LOC109854755 [Pseudomyrmex gracilis]